MHLTDYQALANATAKPLSMKEDLIHASLGLAGEVGELTDTIKKHLIYGKALDVENIREEIGDVLWFCALMATAIGDSLNDIGFQNIEKLRQRYPEKYSDFHASARLDKVSS